MKSLLLIILLKVRAFSLAFFINFGYSTVACYSTFQVAFLGYGHNPCRFWLLLGTSYTMYIQTFFPNQPISRAEIYFFFFFPVYLLLSLHNSYFHTYYLFYYFFLIFPWCVYDPLALYDPLFNFLHHHGRNWLLSPVYVAFREN